MKPIGSRTPGQTGRTPRETFAADPEVKRALTWLAANSGVPKSEWLRRTILSEYVRLNESPDPGIAEALLAIERGLTE